MNRHQMSARMDLSDFDFALPVERIAQHPARPRDTARLLHIGTGLQQHVVRDLPTLLRPGDLLVSNDTRVIPAQLTARRGEARVGITLDRKMSDGTWSALARNARRLREGDELVFDGEDQLQAQIRARLADGSVRLAFNLGGPAFAAARQRAGALALPPYIDRPSGPLPEDSEDYQTVFARAEGAVAAPTAGLHFTPGLLDSLMSRGVRRTTITLHVGAGTFLPVRDSDLSKHHMHAERGEITGAAADAINDTRARGGRIIAVGTTTLRLIETAATAHGIVEAFRDETELFIRPGYRFKAVDVLMTNFHLPRSTLFMLVCAFAGTERMREAYDYAISHGFRFYSYGDACLIERRA